MNAFLKSFHATTHQNSGTRGIVVNSGHDFLPVSVGYTLAGATICSDLSEELLSGHSFISSLQSMKTVHYIMDSTAV